MLILSIILTGNGSFTFAASVENVIKGKEETQSSEPKNYYEMYYSEEHYEEIVSIENLDNEDESKNDDSQSLIEEESDGARETRPYESVGTSETIGESESVGTSETVGESETVGAS